MDTSCVRVMNILYNMELTENEFKAVEEEVGHTERSGLSIKIIKGDKIIGVDHDDRHNVVIREMTDFYSAKVRPNLKPNTRILLKTLINFDELPQKVYTLHQIVKCRDRDSKIIMGIANNMEELKQRIFERFSDMKELGMEYFNGEFSGYDEEKREKRKTRRWEEIHKQLKAVYWLVGEKYDFKHGETRKNIAKITKVFSLHNMRLAIIEKNIEFEKGNWYYRGYCDKEICEGKEIMIQTFKPNSRAYDYVCEGREIYFEYGKKLWVCDDNLLGKITEKEIKLLMSRFNEHQIILTKSVYEREKDALRIKIITAKRKEMEEKSKEKLTKSIIKQFKNGKVCRQGVTITPNSISHNGLMIKGDKVGEFIEAHELPILDTLNFQNILIAYVDFVLERESEWNSTLITIKMTGKRNFRIGNVDIKAEKIGNNFFVNGVKIRSDEIHQVIVSALNFSDKNEYQNWLKEVGRVSLRLKNALRNGITFKFVIDKTDDNCLINQSATFSFNLPLKRSEGKTYVSINGNDHKVRDINALFSLKADTTNYHSNNSLLQRAIKLMFRGITDLNPSDVAEIIKNAQIEYSNRIKRSVEFVENAVRLSSAKKISGGWVVTGDSGTEYFVGKNLEVNTLKNGEKHQYLCLLDTDEIDREDEAQVNDAIAKRILALRHDKTTAKDIWEQGDKVDKLWRNLSYAQ